LQESEHSENEVEQNKLVIQVELSLDHRGMIHILLLSKNIMGIKC